MGEEWKHYRMAEEGPRKIPTAISSEQLGPTKKNEEAYQQLSGGGNAS